MDGREKAILVGMMAGTMLDRVQLAFLYDMALLAPAGIGVECGVARGGSVLCWSAARGRRGHILAIDTEDLDRWAYLKDNLTKWGPQIIFLHGLSWELGAMMVKHQKVAFSFIDACHDEAGVGRDIEVWPRATMPGGIITFHDYSAPKCPDVKRCVDKWQAKEPWERLGQVGSTLALRKPGG